MRHRLRARRKRRPHRACPPSSRWGSRANLPPHRFRRPGGRHLLSSCEHSGAQKFDRSRDSKRKLPEADCRTAPSNPRRWHREDDNIPIRSAPQQAGRMRRARLRGISNRQTARARIARNKAPTDRHRSRESPLRRPPRGSTCRHTRHLQTQSTRDEPCNPRRKRPRAGCRQRGSIARGTDNRRRSGSPRSGRIALRVQMPEAVAPQRRACCRRGGGPPRRRTRSNEPSSRRSASHHGIPSRRRRPSWSLLNTWRRAPCSDCLRIRQ